MKEIRIFYSWQSDIKGKFNRYFIEECLNSAIKNLHKENEIRIDFILDRDTANREGTPDIVNTIFEKVDNSEIFIGDISIINQDSIHRKTPNPNVLIELGYAAGKLGWNRIICVFNSAFGNIEDLPFDVRTRRILPFKFDESLDKKEAQKSLTKTFEFAIKAIDLEEIKFKRQILEEFKTESQEIISIVLKRGDYWEFELIGKLLEREFENLKIKLDELEKGLIFKKTQKFEVFKFLDWSWESIDYVTKIIERISYLLTDELAKAMGEPGESGNPFMIRAVASKLVEGFAEIIRWESELKSIEVSPKIIKLKSLMEGWSKELILQFHHLPGEFKKIYNNEYSEGSNVIIKIDLKTFETSPEIIKTLHFYRDNINLLNED